MEDLKVTACSSVLNDTGKCSYGNVTATEASNELCCCDDCTAVGVSDRTSWIGRFNPNAYPSVGDLILNTPTVNGYAHTWNGPFQCDPYQGDPVGESGEEGHVTTVYKASRKFKRITIK